MLFKVARFVVICYSSDRKLIHSINSYRGRESFKVRLVNCQNSSNFRDFLHRLSKNISHKPMLWGALIIDMPVSVIVMSAVLLVAF